MTSTIKRFGIVSGTALALMLASFSPIGATCNSCDGGNTQIGQGGDGGAGIGIGANIGNINHAGDGGAGGSGGDSTANGGASNALGGNARSGNSGNARGGKGGSTAPVTVFGGDNPADAGQSVQINVSQEGDVFGPTVNNVGAVQSVGGIFVDGNSATNLSINNGVAVSGDNTTVGGAIAGDGGNARSRRSGRAVGGDANSSGGDASSTGGQGGSGSKGGNAHQNNNAGIGYGGDGGDVSQIQK